MASFIQNINKIRGAAIHGPEMREAIAEAITQAIDLDIGGSGDGIVLFTISPIENRNDDFLLDILNQ